MRKYYTDVGIYGSTRPPHMLPKYIPEKRLAREIAYEIVEKGVIIYLSDKNKKYWTIFPLHIGRYSLSNKPHTEKQVEDIRDICLFH
jgi:hypothetical protein